jgi:peptidoglycan hydrolase CwlO-like protein
VKGEYMKKILTVSVLLSIIMMSSAAYAETAYRGKNETQTSSYQDYDSKIETNRNIWEKTVRSYEANYNDSMRKYWDRYTEAYQRQKRIQH